MTFKDRKAKEEMVREIKLMNSKLEDVKQYRKQSY